MRCGDRHGVPRIVSDVPGDNRGELVGNSTLILERVLEVFPRRCDRGIDSRTLKRNDVQNLSKDPYLLDRIALGLRLREDVSDVRNSKRGNVTDNGGAVQIKNRRRTEAPPNGAVRAT